jgi:SAM-dependent methyltransferase
MRLNELRNLPHPVFRQMLLSRAEMRFRSNLPLLVRRFIARGKHFCPVCESSVASFRNFGPDRNAWCPVCLAMARHRAAWLFLKEKTDLFHSGGKRKMLHLAPEPAFAERFSRLPHLEYITADLDGTGVMMAMDITQIKLPDASFDVIYCSHVLEHVPDDLRAMRELKRVLRPSGWALFMVPITVDRTVEDPSITDPGERERLFGQVDHVRRYGQDFLDRLCDSGYDVEITYASQLAGEADQIRMGVFGNEAMYLCRHAKQGAVSST